MKAGRARFTQSRGVGADRGHHLGGDDVAALQPNQPFGVGDMAAAKGN